MSERLISDDYQEHLYLIMNLGAATARNGLHDLAADPPPRRVYRSIKKVEREVLWGAHLAVAQANKVLSHPAQEQLLHSGFLEDAEAMYDLQAALRTIPHLLPPLSQYYHRQVVDAKDILRWPELHFEVQDGLRERAPDVLPEWHKWLWTHEDGKRQLSLPAAILAEGCEQLATSTQEIEDKISADFWAGRT